MTVSILMAGDSLTAGFPDGNGPRQEVYDVLTAASVAFDLVGGTTPADCTVPDPECAAVGGYTTAQVSGLVTTDLPIYTPDIVTLLTGANDAAVGAQDASTMAADIDRLVGFIFRTQPTAVVLLGTCTVQATAAYNTRRLEINEYLAPYAACHIACGRRLVLCDTAGAYTSASLVDNAHPNAAGWEALGAVWAAAILAAISDYGLT